MAKTPQQKAAATRKLNRDAMNASQQFGQYKEAHPERYQGMASAFGDKLRSDEGFRSQMQRVGRDPEVEAAKAEHSINAMGVGTTSRLMRPEQPTDALQRSVDQDNLPGLDHPYMLDTPKRWEDHTPEEQANTFAKMRAFGVDPKGAAESFNTQLDRSLVREGWDHHSFYSDEGQDAQGNLSPRSRLLQSAKDNGVSFARQAAANAATSPQTQFVAVKDGKVSYPNDEAASFAINWARSGKTGDEYIHHPDYYVPKSDLVQKVSKRDGKPMVKADGSPNMVKAEGETRKYPVQGYPKNIAKAVNIDNKLAAGASMKEAWGNTASSDKTGPFNNAWTDPFDQKGNFLVSDVHTGGAGFAPHLSPQKQADYLTQPGVKSYHDFVARKAVAERGLPSVNWAQSSQWNQAKLEKGHHDVGALTHTSTPKAQPSINPAQFGQEKLF